MPHPNRGRRGSVAAQHAVVAFAGAALLSVALVVLLALDVVLAWLISITVATFLAYGYDKRIAGSSRMRVPERVLLALTLAGGTLGALFAMPLFRHKTIKGEFRAKFWLVVAAQVALVSVYFLAIRR